MMKISRILVAPALFAAACAGGEADPAAHNFREAAEVFPMTVARGVTSHALTDYYPQLESADSLTTTDPRLHLTAGDEGWTRFDVGCEADALASSIEVWYGGQARSIAVLAGSRTADAYMTSSGVDDGCIVVAMTQPATDVAAFWRNIRLDDGQITPTADGSLRIALPQSAGDIERSSIRVYAASDDGRFNDILIPLEYGEAVVSSALLDRRDFPSQVLYSLMIDRFSNGNPANDRRLDLPEVLDKVDYYGGDMEGIRQKIDEGFFDDLGITTIWISPITQNPYDAWGLNEDPLTKFSGYHGYWPIYNTAIDKRFGTDAELRAMLDAAHAHGMNVILDYVANHMHIYSPVLREHPDWTTELMLPDGRENIGLYDEQRLTTWFDKHIPTLDLERDEICRPMTDSALYWIENYDFDGFRHDACKHIPLDYWRMLTRKMKTRYPDRRLWQIGETYGSVELIGSYVKSGMIDAQFDFNLYHTAIDVIGRELSAERIARTVEESEAAYGSHHTMGNITGNHDKPRFISLAGGGLSFDEDSKAAGWKRDVVIGDEALGHARLMLLKALIMTVPGVPCIYQGDEYGVPGGNDPDNRRMMRFDGYDSGEQRQIDMTRRLVRLRRSQMPLMYGDMMTLHVDSDVWVFMRHYMGQWAVVALNVSSRPARVDVTLPALAAAAAEAAQTGSDGACAQVAGRSMRISLPPYGFDIITNTK